VVKCLYKLRVTHLVESSLFHYTKSHYNNQSTPLSLFHYQTTHLDFLHLQMPATPQQIPIKSETASNSSTSSLYSKELELELVESPKNVENTSTTSNNFFGAITNKLRSRSRSPTPTPTHAATEPAPPSPRREVTPTPKMTHADTMPQPQRSFSSGSSETAVSRDDEFTPSGPNKRSSTDRSEFQRMTYGRHSGDVSLNHALIDIAAHANNVAQWLFNGFSVTNTVKKVVGKNKKSSN
jgi:hypothetical protein